MLNKTQGMKDTQQTPAPQNLPHSLITKRQRDSCVS